MVRGFKAFNKDMTCRGFQYAIGETFELDVDDVLAGHYGFHFCLYKEDVFRFYPKNRCIVCEIEALGRIEGDGLKYSTNKIRIVRQLAEGEI